MAHNGGISQLNLNFLGLGVGGDFPFINRMKEAVRWSNISGSEAPYPWLFDSDGYPTDLSEPVGIGGVVATVPKEPTSVYSGNWVAKWQGTGTIDFVANNVLVSGSKTGTDGRYVFTSTNNSDFGLRITATTVGDHLHDLVICRATEEALYDSGEIFSPDFIAILVDLKIGALRFLDWQSANTNMQALWAHRTPVTAYSYAGTHYKDTLAAPAITTNTGDAYVVTSGRSLTNPIPHGTGIIVRWNADCTGVDPTIDVDGTGAKNIAAYNAPSFTASPHIATTQKPLTNRNSWLVYDRTFDVWVKNAGDTERASQGITADVPPEVCIALCNKINAHGWFLPYMMTCDGTYDSGGGNWVHEITDYTSSLATLWENTASTGLKFVTEGGPNEFWNFAEGFSATAYGDQKADVYWSSLNDVNNWYGRTASLIGQAVSTVFSNDRSKYECFVGVQTVEGSDGSIDSGWDARMNSDVYVSANGGSAAKNWVTGICITTYWGPGVTPTSGGLYVSASTASAWDAAIATGYVDEYATADATRQQEIIDWHTGNGASNYLAFLPAWYDWAQEFGSMKLAVYEGGPSPDLLTADPFCLITGATKAAQCVLTLTAGHAFIAGMSLRPTSVGGMTELNGNTYTVVSSDATHATIDVNSTGFTTYTSGGNAAYFGYMLKMNVLRLLVYRGAGSYRITQNLYRAVLALANGVMPSQFLLSGGAQNVGAGTGQVWGLYHDHIYGTQSPAYDAIKHFNNNQIRMDLQCTV